MTIRINFASEQLLDLLGQQVMVDLKKVVPLLQSVEFTSVDYVAVGKIIQKIINESITDNTCLQVALLNQGWYQKIIYNPFNLIQTVNQQILWQQKVLVCLEKLAYINSTGIINEKKRDYGTLFLIQILDKILCCIASGNHIPSKQCLIDASISNECKTRTDFNTLLVHAIPEVIAWVYMYLYLQDIMLHNGPGRALRYASAKNLLPVVKKIIKEYPDTIHEQGATTGKTALDWAKEQNHTAIIAVLESAIAVSQVLALKHECCNPISEMTINSDVVLLLITDGFHALTGDLKGLEFIGQEVDFSKSAKINFAKFIISIINHALSYDYTFSEELVAALESTAWYEELTHCSHFINLAQCPMIPVMHNELTFLPEELAISAAIALQHQQIWVKVQLLDIFATLLHLKNSSDLNANQAAYNVLAVILAYAADLIPVNQNVIEPPKRIDGEHYWQKGNWYENLTHLMQYYEEIYNVEHLKSYVSLVYTGLRIFDLTNEMSKKVVIPKVVIQETALARAIMLQG